VPGIHTRSPRCAAGVGADTPQPVDDKKTKEADKNGNGGSGGGRGGDDNTDIDTIINGLLVRLPKSGNVWPDADRKLWLQLVQGSFKLIYKDKAEEKEE
jgi:hypothetical protein